MPKSMRLLSQWRAADFGYGLIELFWMVLFGLMPLWLGFIFLRFRGTEAASAFAISFVDDGELLLIAVALIGPLMYPLLKQYGDTGLTAPFPVNWIFVAAIFVLSSLASGLFYQIKLDQLAKHQAAKILDEPYVFSISLVGTSIAILLTFVILSTRNLMDRVDIPKYFRSDTDQLLEEWRK